MQPKMSGPIEPDLRARIEHELNGVSAWLERLDKHWDRYPSKWREGMYRHYLRRAEKLQTELDALDS